jgi:hypothetical protein
MLGYQIFKDAIPVLSYMCQELSRTIHPYIENFLLRDSVTVELCGVGLVCMLSLSLCYFTLPPAQTLRLALVDPTDKYSTVMDLARTRRLTACRLLIIPGFSERVFSMNCDDLS